VAFGLSDYADHIENIEDYLYGNLEAMRTIRGEDGTLDYIKVETEPCTKTYLTEKFYPAMSFVQKQIEFNSEKLHCLPDNDVEIKVFGEYDEPESSTFSVFFTSCDTLYNANCRSMDEVTEWLAHKYIIVVYTEHRFSQESGREIEETKMARIPINKDSNTHYKFEIQITHLVDLDNLESSYWPIGDRTYKDFYRIKTLPD